METLGHSITKAVEDGRWKPCHVTRASRSLSHLFFADDLLLFGKASTPQAETMMQILQQFCTASGQRVNNTKSKVWYSPNTPLHTIQAISANFKIPSTSNLGKYLGIPLFHGKVHRGAFNYILDTVNKRLGGW